MVRCSTFSIFRRFLIFLASPIRATPVCKHIVTHFNFSIVGPDLKMVTKRLQNWSPGRIVGAFCTIFRARPVGTGLGAKFGRKPAKNQTQIIIFITLPEQRRACATWRIPAPPRAVTRRPRPGPRPVRTRLPVPGLPWPTKGPRVCAERRVELDLGTNRNIYIYIYIHFVFFRFSSFLAGFRPKLGPGTCPKAPA